MSLSATSCLTNEILLTLPLLSAVYYILKANTIIWLRGHNELGFKRIEKILHKA